jgi:hypothetical protein
MTSDQRSVAAICAACSRPPCPTRFWFSWRPGRGGGWRRGARGPEIISREAFFRDTGSADLTDADLEQHAANLAAAVAKVGG